MEEKLKDGTCPSAFDLHCPPRLPFIPPSPQGRTIHPGSPGQFKMRTRITRGLGWVYSPPSFSFLTCLLGCHAGCPPLLVFPDPSTVGRTPQRGRAPPTCPEAPRPIWPPRATYPRPSGDRDRDRAAVRTSGAGSTSLSGLLDHALEERTERSLGVWTLPAQSPPSSMCLWGSRGTTALYSKPHTKYRKPPAPGPRPAS